SAAVRAGGARAANSTDASAGSGLAQDRDRPLTSCSNPAPRLLQSGHWRGSMWLGRGSQPQHRGLMRDAALGERDNPMSEVHVKYDSELFQKFSDRLYAEADIAVS